MSHHDSPWEKPPDRCLHNDEPRLSSIYNLHNDEPRLTSPYNLLICFYYKGYRESGREYINRGVGVMRDKKLKTEGSKSLGHTRLNVGRRDLMKRTRIRELSYGRSARSGVRSRGRSRWLTSGLIWPDRCLHSWPAVFHLNLKVNLSWTDNVRAKGNIHMWVSVQWKTKS